MYRGKTRHAGAFGLVGLLRGAFFAGHFMDENCSEVAVTPKLRRTGETGCVPNVTNSLLYGALNRMPFGVHPQTKYKELNYLLSIATAC